MNICFYGAASSQIDKIYMERTQALAEKFARRGCSLVFGGGDGGNMGAAARGFTEGNGDIIGVVPNFFNVDGILYANCKQMIRTETMRERKQIMEDRADAFVTTPGGIGTFEEFFEIFTLKQLGRHNKPIVIYNVGGYYDSIINMLNTAIEQRFMRKEALTLILVSDNDDEIIDYVLNYSQNQGSVEQFRLF